LQVIEEQGERVLRPREDGDETPKQRLEAILRPIQRNGGACSSVKERHLGETARDAVVTPGATALLIRDAASAMFFGAPAFRLSFRAARSKSGCDRRRRECIDRAAVRPES
jgi:hypothetical protein